MTNNSYSFPSDERGEDPSPFGYQFFPRCPVTTQPSMPYSFAAPNNSAQFTNIGLDRLIQDSLTGIQ
ncbi:hypothetical protein CERSUDRAFT_99878 [Gelatoporia subvermispora B]|uniref:Uncharacterized protein n=1 Tax=Ceriporiopsis subvermispora (strain B) TaxID=914234 RepID=M2P908_CERS8|nr:hypothetical protein CERSUDRAFT_99878 [Gelatoporia subvermispora B]